jgi:putative Ca2+/H+ antiporter (TMEM165/GDT1 family)
MRAGSRARQYESTMIAVKADLTARIAAIGATIGSLVAIVPAALMGEAARLKLPLRPLRVAIGIVFLVVGAVLALGALRLV